MSGFTRGALSGNSAGGNPAFTRVNVAVYFCVRLHVLVIAVVAIFATHIIIVVLVFVISVIGIFVIIFYYYCS